MFLVLHGQTEWNRDGRLQGHGDSALTEEGIAQVRRSAAILRTHLGGAPRIVTSPLGRTMATARLLAEDLGVDPNGIETDTRLKELHMGAWEGLSRARIEAGWPQESSAPRNAWYFQSPNGERYDAIATRLRNWLDAQTTHDDLVVVSHGVASRVLRGLFTGISPEDSFLLEVARDAPFHLANGRSEKLALR
jgi:probable phosphoglycerate mutase